MNSKKKRWILLSLLLLTLQGYAQEFLFERATLDVVPQGSRGVAIGDLDGNGLMDIVVANQVDSLKLLGNTILFNHGDTFQKRAIADNTINAWSESAHAIDIDNDRDLDLFFTTQFGTPNLLYSNDGSGQFSRMDAGNLSSDLTNSPGACWCDYDLDGDMDVFVVNRDGADDILYINDGNGVFKHAVNGPWVGNKGDGRSCAWGDLNGDGWPDLYVANFVVKENGRVTAKHRNHLYLSTQKGGFTEQISGSLAEELNASYGVSLVDFDYDRDLDIYITNVSIKDENALYENLGEGVFKKLTDSEIAYEVRRPSKGQTWGDFNNDGWLDLYIANGTEGYPEIQNFFFFGNQNHTFDRIYNTLPAIEGHISAGTASGDLDNDGDLDLYVCNWGGEAEANDFYINQNKTGQWVKFRLTGQQSNSFGMGSWAILTLDDGTIMTRYLSSDTGYGSQNAPEIHFGIPATKKIKQVEIRWPSGLTQSSSMISANSIYQIIEGEKIKKFGK